MSWPCLCGGHAYTRDELIAMSTPDTEGYAGMWQALLSAGDFYCPDADEVLTGLEALRVRGLRVPVHDECHPDDALFGPALWPAG